SATHALTLIARRPPSLTLFPYTTLFRSLGGRCRTTRSVDPAGFSAHPRRRRRSHTEGTDSTRATPQRRERHDPTPTGAVADSGARIPRHRRGRTRPRHPLPPAERTHPRHEGHRYRCRGPRRRGFPRAHAGA